MAESIFVVCQQIGASGFVDGVAVHVVRQQQPHVALGFFELIVPRLAEGSLLVLEITDPDFHLLDLGIVRKLLGMLKILLADPEITVSSRLDGRLFQCLRRRRRRLCRRLPVNRRAKLILTRLRRRRLGRLTA